MDACLVQWTLAGYSDTQACYKADPGKQISQVGLIQWTLAGCRLVSKPTGERNLQVGLIQGTLAGCRPVSRLILQDDVYK